jgi:hypothetical protein
VRLQKYRGLKSFRTSEWDAREDLPKEYSRVFAFENFTRTRKLAAAATRTAITVRLCLLCFACARATHFWGTSLLFLLLAFLASSPDKPATVR